MRSRVALLGALVFSFLLLLMIDVAVADDCSSPQDCASTAWTVGGAAAAVATIIGAAAASGWLPGSPEPIEGTELSPECLQALESALWDVHERLAEVGQLIVTREGAQRMAIDALGFAQEMDPGIIDATSKGVVDDDAIAKQVARSGGEMGATTMEAISLSNQAAFDRAAEHLSRTAEGLGDIPAGQAARGGAIHFGDEAAAAGGRALGWKWASALTGSLDLASTLVGQVTGVSRIRELQEMGRRKALSEQAIGEAERWIDYADKLQSRVREKEAALNSAIGAYNSKAAACGAKAIDVPEPHEMEDLVSKMGRSARTVAPGSSSSPPAAVLERGPSPIEERRDSGEECEGARAGYDRDIAEFRKQKSDWERIQKEYRRWNQRWKDGYYSYKRYHEEWLEAQRRLTSERTEWTETGSEYVAVSGGVYMAGLLGLLSAPVSVGLGVVTFGLSVRQQLKSPDEWNTVMSSYLDEQLSWVQSRLGYATSETTRLNAQTEQHRQNLYTLGWQLQTLYRRCGEGQGWTQPPEYPDFASIHETDEPRLVSLKEMSTWR